MSALYYIQVRTPEMTWEVLRCYLADYGTKDFNEETYQCDELGTNPYRHYRSCSHEQIVHAADDHSVAIATRNYELDYINNPDRPCDCEELMAAAEDDALDPDEPEDPEDTELPEIPECHYCRNLPPHPLEQITDAIHRHSGDLAGIAKLDEHLAAHIRQAVAPETGYHETGPFSRQQINLFLNENMGAEIFIDCA